MNNSLLGIVYYCGSREYREPSHYDDLFKYISYVNDIIKGGELTDEEFIDCITWVCKARYLLRQENTQKEFILGFECVETRLP